MFYGINGKYLDCFQSYLTGRRQLITYNVDDITSYNEILCGGQQKHIETLFQLVNTELK